MPHHPKHPEDIPEREPIVPRREPPHIDPGEHEPSKPYEPGKPMKPEKRKMKPA